MTVAGHLEFAKVMAKYDIKPIFGCELYHGVRIEFGRNERDQAHFVAGAMTNEGLRNLWRLVDASSTNYRYVCRVSTDMLRKHREGMFATSACISGLVAKGVLHGDPYPILDTYLDIYRDNFYIELHTYPGEDHEVLNTSLVQIAYERGIPVVYATDAHFASPEQYEMHDAYVAMQTGQDVYTPIEERKMWHPRSLYIQDEEQIRASLAYLPDSVIDEALANTLVLADRCDAQLPEVRRHLPAFIPKECPWVEDDSITAPELFIDLVQEGIERRYGRGAGAYVWDRAFREMEVFLDAGLEHYFLQTWDFCEFCNRNRIKRGPGRGSAAGTITTYALGITDVDPLKYDLIFERFYNPGREKGFPDIDNDFPVRERKRVRQYLMDRWGADKVRTIGTIRRMKPKAVIDKTYRVFGISWDTKEALKKIIDQVPDIDILGSDSIGWAEDIDPGKTIYVEASVGDKITEWMGQLSVDERTFVSYWLDMLSHFCSRVDGYGVHPSGVVVSDVSLADELPCLYNRDQDIQYTCFPMSDVDSRLFLKQDLLGLRNLDTLQTWEDQMKAKMPDLDIDWSSLDDGPEEMWQMLDAGLTLGIFQIEKGYARQLCKEFRPRSIEDLGVIVALNRPGPIRSGAPDSFIRRRRGDEEITYDHPILEDILRPTYGWFLYQEQVIAFFNKMGYTLSESDAVRKILGKKKPEQMLALKTGEGEWSMESTTVDGDTALVITSPSVGGERGHTTVITNRGYVTMSAAAGIDSATAEIIWGRLEDFAKYSFNKSHAIAYALIVFRTLFAKFYGAAEFIIACIITNPEGAGDYVGEGRRMGIMVLPPDIQESHEMIRAVGDKVYFGYSNVRGLGLGTGRYIMELRDKYDVSTPEALSAAIEVEQLVWERHRKEAREIGASFKRKSPRQMLPANRVPALYDAGAWDNYLVRDIALSERQKLEREYLGVIITDDCDEIFARNWQDLENCNNYVDLEESSNEKLYLPGAIATLTPRRTKRDGKAMGIVTIEYQGDEAEMVVFPREWAAYKWFWRERIAGIFTVVKTERGLRFEDATRLT